jgi:CRISPR-associated protein Csm1
VKRETAQSLIEYGQALLRRVAGGQMEAEPAWVGGFLELLGSVVNHAPLEAPLPCIFSLIATEGPPNPATYLRPVPLDLPPPGALDWDLMPVSDPSAAAGGRHDLYRAFRDAGGESEQDFTRFFYLMRKYATTLPNTIDQPGVSLFEQWKLVAALAAIGGSTSRVPASLGLVGGDIPGIQRTINTVTSKGAAKAMRGRSAFIQLLGHALVERLLDALALCPANVVYDAGGNFVLLTGWDEALAESVRDVAIQANQVLLAGAGAGKARFDGFHGDLSVALAAVEIPLEVLRTDLPLVEVEGLGPVSTWVVAEKRVKDAVEAAKARPFGDLARTSDGGWQTLFDPEPAETADFCAVCRRQRGKDEKFVPLDPDTPEGLLTESNAQCPECAGFRDLAQDLARPRALLLTLKREPGDPSAWQRALYAVTGLWHEVGDASQTASMTLALSPSGFPAPGVDGFRPLARTTPLTADPETGRQTITTNEQLAEASGGGLKRLAVLRMDVDDLGLLLVKGLPRRSVMQTAELSQALERFFAGWLDRICARVGRGLFYVLYAGGDDLLAIGPWTHIPALAQEIRADFHRYTGAHDAIHLSAGIAVVGEKAPLYAAAGEAHEALGAAKRLEWGDPARLKNAVTFLGRSYGWSEFQEVAKLKDLLAELVTQDGLPSGLLAALLAIVRRYEQDVSHDERLAERAASAAPVDHPDRKRGDWGPYLRRDGRSIQVYYGPWMWRQAYAVSRLGEARSGEVKAKLEKLETALLEGQIAQLGLAARWAQWVTRKER